MARSVRSMSSVLSSYSYSYSYSYCLPNKTSCKMMMIRFASKKPETGADKTKIDKEKDEANTGANKCISGGGYAKRSDEQGFGAVHGGNQSLSKEDEDKIVHANVPEYDRSKKT